MKLKSVISGKLLPNVLTFPNACEDVFILTAENSEKWKTSENINLYLLN